MESLEPVVRENKKQFGMLNEEGDGFVTEWVENLENELYHANKEAVGSGLLRKMLKSPATFQAFYKDLAHEEETDAMRFGTLVHKAILEPASFLDGYVVEPKFIGFTKDGRESALSADAKKKKQDWRDGLPLGTQIVTQDELHDLQGITKSILEHEKASELLKNGKPEISGFYVDKETGVKCRIRPDFLSFDLMALVDIKTCQDCSIEAFSRVIWQRRYDLQLAMYCEGAQAISNKKVEYPIFIAVEKKPPYECAVYTCDDALMEIGLRDYNACLKKLKTCIETNDWPRYSQNEILSIGLPNWALKEF